MATPAEVQLALRLRSLRDKAGLRQGDLATLFSQEQKVGAAAISSWENPRNPSILPESRIEPYARLFSALTTPPSLIPDGQLTPKHVTARDALQEELKRLVDAARGGATASDVARISTYRSWFFDDDGPAVIIAPDAPQEGFNELADQASPNYTDLYRFADLDALIELHGHIRAENDPNFSTFFRLASTVNEDDLSAHVILLGGIAWNPVTRRLLRELQRVPVRQIEDPRVTTGEIFTAEIAGEEHSFYPVWSEPEGDEQPELEEDVAFLARVRNPFNSSRTLTFCNGIHSRGVLGAVRTLTDARLRDANESYLATHFPQGEFALLLRVPVFRGKALSPDLQNPYNILYAWPEQAESLASMKAKP